MAMPKVRIMPKVRMKPFTMVRRSLWDSKRFGGLPDDQTRFLYFYCLTCPHQTPVGCFAAKVAYVLEDLKKPGSDWTPELLAVRLRALVDAGLILHDADTNEILIVDWWKDNGPTNDDWMTGAAKQCEAIESQRLKEAALAALEVCREAMSAARGLPSRAVPRALGPTVTPRERLASIGGLR